jgi:quinol monooxygenase YgiN
MLIQSIHFTIGPENADRAQAMFKELQELSRREAGVLSFEIGRSRDKPNVFALWEKYRDEAALKAHVESEHFVRLVVNGVRSLARERLAETVFPIE